MIYLEDNIHSRMTKFLCELELFVESPENVPQPINNLSDGWDELPQETKDFYCDKITQIVAGAHPNCKKVILKAALMCKPSDQ